MVLLRLRSENERLYNTITCDLTRSTNSILTLISSIFNRAEGALRVKSKELDSSTRSSTLMMVSLVNWNSCENVSLRTRSDLQFAISISVVLPSNCGVTKSWREQK